MTYSLFVLISPDSLNVHDEVDRLVAPYCLFIDRHETDCSCVTGELERRAHDEVMKQRFASDSINFQSEVTSGWQSRLAKLSDTADELTPDRQRELQELLAWDAQAHLKKDPLYLQALEAVKQQFRAHPEQRLTDRECKLCGGVEKVMSDENPQGGYFDSYAIGGSCTALLAPTLKEHPDAMDAFPVSRESSDLWQYREAVVPVRLLDEDYPLPYAVVTPDGVWRERDDLDELTGNETNWFHWCHETFKEHSHCLCVVCNYHC